MKCLRVIKFYHYLYNKAIKFCYFHQQFLSVLSPSVILVKGLKLITGFYFSYKSVYGGILIQYLACFPKSDSVQASAGLIVMTGYLKCYDAFTSEASLASFCQSRQFPIRNHKRPLFDQFPGQLFNSPNIK